MIVLDGKKVAKDIRIEIKKEASLLFEETGKKPGLAVVIVGEDSASEIYVATKEKTARKLGFRSDTIRFPADTPEVVIIDKIKELNQDEGIDGLLIQLPLPKGYDTWKILETLDPRKDVDRFHPLNLGLNVLNRVDIFPCTPAGILKILDYSNISVSGLNVVVVGRSFIVGKPMAAMFTNRNATVTLCHSKTKNLADHLVKADVIVAAVGVPGMITPEMVREGAILIDVGMNYLKEEAEVLKYCSEEQIERFRKKGYGITGDIHPQAFEKSSYYTPVPGGIGKMTVAMLMDSTLKLFKKYRLKK